MGRRALLTSALRPGCFAASLLTLALLPGCASSTYTTVKVYPPADLVQDCSVTRYEIDTNADLAKAIISLRSDLRVCNNDKKALRLWMEDE
jgi:hypothetical protein